MIDPLVSIKAVTYNHAPYIAQAIEGFLIQKTNFPFELVIGEDCSTDGTREIVFDYQNKYPELIRVITSDRNVGGKKNAYRTTKSCRGKYIAFCEGDDYWHDPFKLQKQWEYLESHPECGLVFTDHDFYFEKIKKGIKSANRRKGFREPLTLTIEQIVGEKGAVIRTCTVMVREDLYTQIIERDPYLHHGGPFLMGDTQLFAEFAAMSKIVYIPESMATYRILDESASRSKDPIKSARFWKSAAEMKLYLCKKYNLPEEIQNKVNESWCDSTLRLALHSRSSELAEEVLRKKKVLTWKEWLRYLGAKNSGFHYTIYILNSISKLRKKDSLYSRYDIFPMK